MKNKGKDSYLSFAFYIHYYDEADKLEKSHMLAGDYSVLLDGAFRIVKLILSGIEFGATISVGRVGLRDPE